VLQRQLAARQEATAADATSQSVKSELRSATAMADTHAADTAMAMAADAAEAAARAAEEAESQVEMRMHSELDDLEEMLEKIAAVAPAIGAGAQLATELAKGDSKDGGGAPAGGGGATKGGGLAAKGKGKAALKATPPTEEEGEKLAEMHRALKEVKKQLQAREVEVTSLKTSLKAARAAANPKGGAPSSPRRQSSLGGLDFSALLGGGDDAAAAAADMELSELEKTISAVEGALERRGVWRKPPNDSAIGAVRTPGGGLLRSTSSPSRLPTRAAADEQPNFWEQIIKAVVPPKPDEGATAVATPSKAGGKAVAAALEVDVSAERRKEEAKIADLAVASRALLATSKARQSEMRDAADALAEEASRARTEGGEATRALMLRLGEAELEVETLKRYLREAERVPDSPTSEVCPPSPALSPVGGNAAVDTFVTVGVPLSAAAGPMSGAGAAALERARARAQEPVVPALFEPSMDDWATDEGEGTDPEDLLGV